MWLYEDSDTDVLRQLFVDLQRAWDEYAETDELRWEGLQEVYIIGLWDVQDTAEGPSTTTRSTERITPFYRTLMIDRGHSGAFRFELDGDPIYITYKAVDFAFDFASPRPSIVPWRIRAACTRPRVWSVGRITT